MSELEPTTTETQTTPNPSEGKHLRIPGTPEMAAPAALDNPKADQAALDDLERHLYTHRYAISGIATFSSTIDPPKSSRDSAEAMAILEQEDHELLCSEETGALLDRLQAHSELLTPTQLAQVKVLRRSRAQLVDVPSDEQADFTRLTREA